MSPNPPRPTPNPASPPPSSVPSASPAGPDRGRPARITLVVARADNGVIGHDNRLPWHLPEELAHFRALTTGHPIVMGRRTWDSIGRPLPGRTSIVVSRGRPVLPDGVLCAADPDAAIALARRAPGGAGEVFVIGGAGLFAHFLPLADRIVLTEVHVQAEGDVRMPAFDESGWHAAGTEPRNSASGLRFTIRDLRRGPAG